MVDPDRDLGTRNELACGEMLLQDLLGEAQFHDAALRFDGIGESAAPVSLPVFPFIIVSYFAFPTAYAAPP